MIDFNWYAMGMFILDLLIVTLGSRAISQQWFKRDTERGVFLLLIYSFFWIWSAVDIIKS